MPPFVPLVAKFSPIEIVVIGLLFWLLLAYLHMQRNRRG
jgi:hypothetical protein